ncbi:MAG: hypothetical protein M1524_03730, partial [Patescibacteria group bacterium]|nr:hypothetical protein [Patescibacteria group bacterium]
VDIFREISAEAQHRLQDIPEDRFGERRIALRNQAGNRVYLITDGYYTSFNGAELVGDLPGDERLFIQGFQLDKHGMAISFLSDVAFPTRSEGLITQDYLERYGLNKRKDALTLAGELASAEKIRVEDYRAISENYRYTGGH